MDSQIKLIKKNGFTCRFIYIYIEREKGWIELELEYHSYNNNNNKSIIMPFIYPIYKIKGEKRKRK